MIMEKIPFERDEDKDQVDKADLKRKKTKDRMIGQWAKGEG